MQALCSSGVNELRVVNSADFTTSVALRVKHVLYYLLDSADKVLANATDLGV